jgi:O-antigen/teichoic acid export membrane protein
MSLQRQTLSGAFWSLTGQIGLMAIGLLTNIILARLLSPFQFGQMGVLMFFIILANIFTESGFGGALVRKKNISPIDYSTAFIFNLGVSVSCFLVLVLFSGKISLYYKDPALQKLLIVVGSVLLINAFNFTQQAKLVKELKFKKLAIIQLTAVVISSIVSICMAYLGFGIWALVTFQLLTPFINTSCLILFDGSLFAFAFSRAAFKEMYAFGVNTTATALIATGFDNIYSLILGRFFSINQAGFYYQAKRLQDVPFKIFNFLVQGVVFSSLSKLQDETERFIAAYNKIVLLFTILMGGITALIYLYADSIIGLLYGQKWVGAVVFMKLLSIGSFFYFQELLNMVIFKVFNQTRKILVLEIFKKIIQVVSIVIGIYTLDIIYLLYGFVVSSFIGYLLNYYYSRKILGKVQWFEALTIIKVIFASIICVLVCNYLIMMLKLSVLSSLVLFPIFVCMFLALLTLLRTADLKAEFRFLFALAKKDKAV